MNEIQSLSLCCKPTGDPANAAPSEFLFSVYYPSLDALISLRSLDLQTDTDLIYEWVNQPYSKKFWQMNGSRGLITRTYQEALINPYTHSFIGLINGKTCFQIDAYSVAGDELRNHIQLADHDSGLHLLMAPPKMLKKGWSLAALQAFQDYYFSFSVADRLFGEPDRENNAANQLSSRAGFQFLKEIQMSYKMANLYCLSRSHYQILRTSGISL